MGATSTVEPSSPASFSSSPRSSASASTSSSRRRRAATPSSSTTTTTKSTVTDELTWQQQLFGLPHTAARRAPRDAGRAASPKMPTPTATAAAVATVAATAQLSAPQATLPVSLTSPAISSTAKSSSRKAASSIRPQQPILVNGAYKPTVVLQIAQPLPSQIIVPSHASLASTKGKAGGSVRAPRKGAKSRLAQTDAESSPSSDEGVVVAQPTVEHSMASFIA
ncbi:hypothetical protein HK405_014008, partial [Cladochytrium tenue]